LRTYTIAEAADLTGLSRKAIARRVERGSLRSVVRNGRRRIPRSELARAGLLDGPAGEAPLGNPGGASLPHPAPGGELAEAGTAQDMLAALFREVLDRFERQSQEIAQYRALTVQAESLRLSNELAELRVRLAELERGPAQPPVHASSPVTDLGRRVSELSKQVEELSNREIWVPPRAATRAAPEAPGYSPLATHQPRAAPQPSPSSQASGRRRSRPGRTARFVAEAAIIVAVAVVVWRAQLSTPAIAVAMGVTWTFVAAVEWLSSERT
jgi:excisionase family DNA binding protein